MKNFFAGAAGYLKEVKSELHRISWPGRKELVDSTIVVIVFIFILSATTLVYDWLIELFLRLAHA